ncbi:MAG: FHA domain-containing protein, partial [Planctomycetaceae bacterium]
MSMMTAPARFADIEPASPLAWVLEPLRDRRGRGLMLRAQGSYVIGSSSECALPLTVRGVQPEHCRIDVESGVAVVTALDPRTWINDGPARETKLRPGDRLTIGPVEFRIRPARPDEEPPPVQRTEPAAAPPVSVP